jgi:putative DNA primase/helicase
MNKLLKIEEIKINVEENIDSLASNEQKAKEIFNSFLKVIPTFDVGHWAKIMIEYGVEETIGNVNHLKIYKVATMDFLIKFGQENKWDLAKDGNKIYIYNGEFWIEIEKDLMKQFLKLATNKLGVPKWVASDANFIDDMFKQLLSAGFFDKMEHKNKTLLNLENGTLHVDSNGFRLENFNKQDFLTHQMNFQFDEVQDNLLWLDFLDTVLPDKDTQKTLQESLAYLFTKDLKLEKAIFLYGTGSNGKSVVFEVLQGLIPNELMTNYSLESLAQASGYHRVGLHNKLVNYGTDISMKKIEHGIFKQLVSGEPIEARQIYQEPFIMKNYAKLIFNLNKIDDADVESTIGFFRRMVFIPFEKTIAAEEQDKNLHKKILQNKIGVLNWILEGISQVLRNKEIFISQQCDNFLENFKKESNIAIRFLEYRNFRPSETETTTFQGLYETFKLFCRDQGEYALSQRSFNSELKKLDYKFSRRTNGFVWHGSYQ